LEADDKGRITGHMSQFIEIEMLTQYESHNHYLNSHVKGVTE